MKIGAVKFHDISFRTADATGWPFFSACLPREITGCFDGPILQLRGSAAGFHFSSKVNLILSARIVCLFRSVCARARALWTQWRAHGRTSICEYGTCAHVTCPFHICRRQGLKIVVHRLKFSN